MNAVAFNLAKIEWDYFGTLTYKKVPNRAIRKKCIFHFLRLVAQAYGLRNMKWDLQWAIRHEFGEKTLRPHFHFLLKSSKFDIWNNKKTTCKFLESLWEAEVAGSCGFAQVRTYDPTKSGAEYIMKADQGWFTSAANQYEMEKFYFENMSELDLPLLVAPSVLWELRKRKKSGVRRGEGNDGVGLARYLRSLRSEKDKSIKPSTSIPSPCRFVHPADPFHI